MEQEGEEREDREAQTALERAVPERGLEGDRDEGDEGAEEEVQAEDRGVARSRLRSPEVGDEAADVRPRGRAGPGRPTDRGGGPEADQDARREGGAKDGVRGAREGARNPEPEDDREGDRHPVQGHRPPLPPRGRGVRDEGHRARAHEGPAEPVAHADEGVSGRGDIVLGPRRPPPSPWLTRTRASWSGLAATAYRSRLTASHASPRLR